MFKSKYEPEPCVKNCTLSRQQRSALAKFRCGVAPLRIVTGRYSALPVNERTCSVCTFEVEDETHVLLKCPLYDAIRTELFNKISQINADFTTYNDLEKFKLIMSNESIVKYSANTCNDILIVRRKHLYN